jgi:putative DNA primase/helicase
LTGINNAPQAIARMFEEWSKFVHGIEHRYSTSDGWSILRSSKYKKIEDPEDIEIYVQKYLSHCYRRHQGVKKRIAIIQSLTNNIIANLRSLSSVHIKTPAPAYLGKKENRNTDYILSFNNCLTDISRRPATRIKHHANYYIMNQLEYDYDKKAGCPLWEQFLEQIFESDAVNDPSIQILQEIMGLLLTRETKYQKIFALVGPKRSGKGTIIKVLIKLLGRNRVTTTNLTQMPTHFGMQNLIGKTVAIIPDASFDSRRTNILRAAEILKSISGEDPVEIHRKYKVVKEYIKLPLRFVIVSNSTQALSDPTGALASRFIFLVTTQSFYGRENKELANQLFKELPGIFNWSLKGLRRLEKRGYFLESKRGQIVREETEQLGSSVIAFVKQCCIEGKGGHVKKKELFASYRNWAVRNGLGYLSVLSFYKNLKSAFPACPDKQMRVKDKRNPKKKRRQRVFKNIRVRKEWKI